MSNNSEKRKTELLFKTSEKKDEPVIIAPKIRGIKKVNKKGIVVGGIIVTIVLVASSVTFSNNGGAVADNSAKKTETTEFNRGAMWYAKIPEVPAPDLTENRLESEKAVAKPVPDLSKVNGMLLADAKNLSIKSSSARETGTDQLQNNENDARKGQKLAAYSAPLPFGGGGGGDVPPKAPESRQSELLAMQQAAIKQAAFLSQKDGAGGSINSGQDEVDDDLNKQEQKAQFQRDAKMANDPDYHQELKKVPISPYEVKAGSIIPAVMISGINSDLPGQVIAQVKENVYDTRSGNSVLIPQGSRLIGLYNSQVAYGQERVMLAWNRIIYADGSSINLKGMPGTDKAGYAGFTDKVNNHYAKIFGSAILVSIIGAGIELAQPEGKKDDKKSRARDSLQESLSEQIGRTAIQMTQKNLGIQPTIEVRPGYEFNIMVTADLILPPVK